MPKQPRRPKMSKSGISKVGNVTAERLGGRSTPSSKMVKRGGKALPSPNRSRKK